MHHSTQVQAGRLRQPAAQPLPHPGPSPGLYLVLLRTTQLSPQPERVLPVPVETGQTLPRTSVGLGSEMKTLGLASEAARF